jgi:hypothetical protein
MVPAGGDGLERLGTGSSEREMWNNSIISPPLLMRMLEKYPRLRRLPARMVGIGFRPEHIGPRPALPEKEVRFRNRTL